MKSLGKKLFITFTICLSVLIGSFAGVFLSNAFKTIYADDDYNLTIAKVVLYQKKDNDDKSYYFFDEENKATNAFDENGTINQNVTKFAQNRKNDDYVFMLKNANIETKEDSSNVTYNAKEYMLVQFVPKDNSSFVNLSVNASLSDSSYSPNTPVDISTLETTSSTITNVLYCQLFDLNNTYLLDTSAVNGRSDEPLNEYDAQGKYTFNFTYNIKDNRGQVTTNKTANTEFYVLNENFYLNPNNDSNGFERNNLSTVDTNRPYSTVYSNNHNTNSIYTEPRLFNTERIDRSHFINDEVKIEQNYFSYSNQFTVDYNGEANKQGGYLYYPTLKYDATKYNLSYSRIRTGITYNIISSLDISGAYPKLVLTETNNLGTVTKTTEITDVVKYTYKDLSKQREYDGYIVTLNFEDVGKYVLEFDYVLNNVAFVTPASSLLTIEKENWEKIGNDQLTIFGYQLEHSEYKNQMNATEKEMKSVTYKKITDRANFDAFNTYEFDAENGVYFSTLDNGYNEDKNYYKRTRLFADVTNLNIVGDHILGQKTNSTQKGNELIFDISKTLEKGFETIAYGNYAVIDQENIEFDANTTYELTSTGYDLTDDTSYVAEKTYYKYEEENNIKITASPYTNQAPLFFNYYAEMKTKEGLASIDNNFYYHYTKSGNTYTIDKTDEQIKKYSLTSNSRFTDNGLYVVVLSYGMPDYYVLNENNTAEKSAIATKVQIFVFEIANVEPKILINPVENDTNLEFGARGYTNKDVKIDWTDSIESPFDVAPQIRVFKQAFGTSTSTEITNSFDSQDYENGKITLSQNGIYGIRVDYGPCTYNNGEYIYSASVTYTFIIDKDEINSIQFYEIGAKYNEFGQNQNMTSKNFALLFGNASTEDIKDSNETIIDTKLIANGTKDSGAIITATYTYLPINATIDTEITSPIDANEKYIANNTSITVRNENITYNQSYIQNNINTAEFKNVLFNDGLYIFSFVDEAGNKQTKYVLKDTTKPLVLQKVNDEYSIVPASSSNKENIVNQNTTLIWGSHKAIKIENALLHGNENNNYDLTSVEAFKNNIYTKNYYTISFNLIDTAVTAFDKNNTYEKDGDNYHLTADTSYDAEKTYYSATITLIDKETETFDINATYYEIKNNSYVKVTGETDFDRTAYLLVENNTEYATTDKQGIYSYDDILSNKISIYFTNTEGKYEKTIYSNSTSTSYTIKATDSNGNIITEQILQDGELVTVHPTEQLFRINMADKLGNKFNGLLEMSFDNSALQAWVLGNPANNVQTIGADGALYSTGDGASRRLYKNNVSNKKLLSFSWIAGEDDFEVVSVVAHFYALTFETESKNYPYAETAQQFNLMERTTTETINGITRTKSAEVNLVQDDRYGEQSTVQGYYKIVRTYRNGESQSYDFYIDRNNIISFDENFTANNRYIGNQIAIVLGDQTNEYKFAGSDFLQEFITNFVLQTNKQPAKISFPAYKYDFAGRNSAYSKININKLRISITNENGEPAEINQSGLYTVNIYDNSYDDGLTPEYCTSIQFKILVDLHSPVAEFVNEDNQTITSANQNSHISTNSTKVSLNWENIGQNDRMAKIDENNITITKINEANIKTVIYKIVNGTVSTNPAHITENIVKTSNGKCYIDLDMFANLINENCRVEITIKYQTQDDNVYANYISSKKIIYFDFEKPKTNYANLINNDKYLSDAQKQSINNPQNENSFDNYNADINFENYAFVVPSTYRLTTPTANTFWQEGIEGATSNPNDVQTVWYRQYNKYADESGVNAQSIVPGDDRYDDTTKAPTRYRFNPNTKVNGKTIYTQITSSLEEFDLSSLNSNSYYEIIEMDCAGNYRIYTIYIPNVNEAEIEYQRNFKDETVMDTQYITDYTKTNSFEIDSQKLQITKINNIGEWFTISVTDGSTGALLSNPIKVAPTELDGFVSKQDAINALNSIIVDDEKVGKYFIISIISSMYEPIVIEFHTPGIGFELDFNLTTVLNVTINQNKYNGVTYITSFQVYEGNDLLAYDSNNNLIKTNFSLDDELTYYTFTYSAQNPRHLWFVYTDNFGEIYRVNKILGITQTPFEEMLTFNGSFIQNTNFKPDGEWNAGDRYAEYYTNASQVIMKYQPLIYIVDENGFEKVGDDEYSNKLKNYYFNESNSNANVKEIEIFDLNDEFGTDEHYIITFTDTSQNKYLFSIHHYNKLAQLNFIDSNGNNHNFDESDANTYETSVSRIVYLQYEAVDTSVSYPIETNVTVSRTYYDSNNVKLTQDYGIVSNQFVFNELGIYAITAKNSLGTTKTYKFEFIRSEATYFSVKANINGRTVELSPSGQIKHDNIMHDHYLSIYDAIIDVNQERNLKYQEIDPRENAVTRYYKIVSNDNSAFKYEKYIAITKISVTSNILGGGMYLNDLNVTGANRYLRTNEKTVTLSIPAYFENQSNKLRIRIVYGNTDLGYIDADASQERINVDLTSAGIYYIYISDIAGNNHSFGGTAFYTLSLVNNFVYNLNGERGIYNSIFNNTVSLAVLQTDSFVRDNNGSRYTISAILNGNSYTPSYVNGTYVFNSYGTYYVTLKGYINEISDENLVQTEIKFTILNANEAKLMHEYIGLNGYEVIKIEKNGTDITNLIREQLDVGTINQFALYGGQDGVGGNGNYVITVSALIDKIIGDKEFSYAVWINKDTDILILSDLAEGESTTNNIRLTMNLYQIYSKVGECKVRLNGEDYITINSTTASENAISTYTLKQNMRYNVTLETNSGNTILSFVVTKVEPLNTVAIVVIVIASVVVVGLTVTFILLRKKMRIK